MEDKTTLGLTLIDKIVFICLATIIGSVAGVFIKILAKWAAKIPIIPFSPLWEWISEWDGRWVPIVGIVIGAVAGIMFSFFAFNETLHITVKDEAVTFRFKEEEETLPSSDIGPVYMDRKVLVVLDPMGRELYRGKPEAKRYKVVDAFRHHGYQWEEQDPYFNEYHRWGPKHPDFPAHVNAMLTDRKQALEDDKADRAEALRKDLTAEGVVVRDEKKQQYVRMVKV